MTLFDLTRELFSYLVRFRQLAASSRPPALAQVQRDVEDIFARMQEGARAHPHLTGPYEQVRYPLAALVDEVMQASEWMQASQWEQELLERRLYGTAEAGRRFFELAADLQRAPQDVVAVYYMCLALGFHGQYSPKDPRLQAVKAGLLARLPSHTLAGAERVAPPQPRPAPVAAPRPQPAPSPRPAPAAAAPAKAQPPPAFSAALSSRQPRKRALGLAAGGLAAAGLVAALTGLWPRINPTPPHPITQTRTAPTPSARPEAAMPVAAPSAPLVSPASPVSHEAPPANPLTVTPAVAAQPAAAPLAPPAAAPPSPPPQPAPAAASQGAEAEGFAVQAGLYVGPIQSNRLAEQLTQAGFSAWVVEKPRADGKVRYIVLVGPFAQREQALLTMEEIKKKFRIQPFLADPEGAAKPAN